MMKNPVMFVVEGGSVLTTLQFIRGIVKPIPGVTSTSFELQNIKEGSQPDSLFAIPSDYQKFDMGNMMRGMGRDQ